MGEIKRLQVIFINEKGIFHGTPQGNSRIGSTADTQIPADVKISQIGRRLVPVQRIPVIYLKRFRRTFLGSIHVQQVQGNESAGAASGKIDAAGINPEIIGMGT